MVPCDRLKGWTLPGTKAEPELAGKLPCISALLCELRLLVVMVAGFKEVKGAFNVGLKGLSSVMTFAETGALVCAERACWICCAVANEGVNR